MRTFPTRKGASLPLAVGLVGPGLIGKTLIKQIAKQDRFLKERLGVDVALVGVTSSRRMLLDPSGLSLSNWQDSWEASTSTADLDSFTQHFADLDMNAVIFDCTASDAPCDYYSKWLAAGIHVITPNKKLHSGALQRYQEVRALQASGAGHYFYEASCGAGLPVLSTLKGLIESGDRVLSIEGILSGTLSYIFNTWRAGQAFSDVVLKAKELGFTEPDPREDLAGTDVARKVVILARECCAEAVLEDLSVSSLVPDELVGEDVAGYLAKLPEHDGAMAARLESAQAAGKVLRYVGKYDAVQQRCSITLAEFPAEHPFAALRGTDNIVQIRTERYDEQPLIIRGPGAGPEVTAAGCFADMLQLTRYLGARS